MINSKDRLPVIKLLLWTYGAEDIYENVVEDVDNLEHDVYLVFTLSGNVKHTLVQDLPVHDGEYFHFNKKSLVGKDSVVQCKNDCICVYKTERVRSLVSEHKTNLEKFNDGSGLYRISAKLLEGAVTRIKYEKIK